MIYCLHKKITSDDFIISHALKYQIEAFNSANKYYKNYKGGDEYYLYCKNGFKFYLKTFGKFYEMIKEDKSKQYLVEDQENLDILIKHILCPICKKNKNISLRYPNAVCNNCYNKTKTEFNEPIHFGNKDIFGGFISLVNDVRGNEHICYIDGIKCYADEARFGGIVIQVIN